MARAVGIPEAVQAREDELREAFAENFHGTPPGQRPGLAPPAGAVPEQVLAATVLYSEIRGFTALAERLDRAAVAELLTRYSELASVAVLRHGGAHLHFVGDSFTAVFAADAPDTSTPAARRAVSAALAVALAAHAFRGWLAQRFADRVLPPFAIGIGLHAGRLTLCRHGGGGAREMAPAGEAVVLASRLQSASRELGWTVVASSVVLEQAGAGVQTGGMTSLQLGGAHGWVDGAEIVGLEAGASDPEHDTAERPEAIRLAVQVNSELTARAVKGALGLRLSTLKDHRFGPGDAPWRLKGYRITRKLAAGSLAQVYLGVRERDGVAVVLKVLEAGGRVTGEHLSRFVQDHALLSRIEDPHVVRIHDHGFSDEHAYIAMEYFERGDLRTELRAGMARARVLEVVRQVAQALQAIHARGVIHRDLKPENVMVRADGSVALADFGVAKSMLQEDKPLRGEGDRVGTPYYLSPEQAAGEAITPAADLYSLGVMFHEMLTGVRPYTGDTLDLLLSRHLSAPIPRLPAAHADLQPVLDRLMAKRPQERYPDAGAVLEALKAVSNAVENRQQPDAEDAEGTQRTQKDSQQ